MGNITQEKAKELVEKGNKVKTLLQKVDIATIQLDKEMRECLKKGVKNLSPKTLQIWKNAGDEFSKAESEFITDAREAIR